MKKQKNNNGVTVMAIMAITFVVCLVTVIGVYYMHRFKINKRDNQRKADLAQITVALDRYYKKFGHYPIGEGFSTDSEWKNGGAQTIGNPLRELVDLKYLTAMPLDPVNATTGCTCGQGYRYYYCHYEPGSGQACVRDANDSEVLSNQTYHLSTCLERSTAPCQVVSGGVTSAIGNFSPTQ